MTLTFEPATGYTGAASFAYQVSDGIDSANATVTGTITPDIVNTAPVAVDDTFEGVQDTTLTINAADLLANDTDADGDVLTITDVADLGTDDGLISLSDDGLTLTFEPAAGYFGAASFGYTVSDGTDTADATVTGTLTEAGAELTVNVSAADNGQEYQANNDIDETFIIANAASYEYAINGFELDGVDVLDMPDGTTMDNTALDGEARLEWASDGVIVGVTLLGLTDAQDTQLATLAGMGDSLI